ncbi:hypothetical protein DXA14_27365 [Hungatella hathewayi]|nr:hypothetical protein DXA14_27365 [Hungatella hathewayi]
MEEFNDFEAILAIKASDWPIAMKAIPYIKKNLKPKHVVVVSAENLRSQLQTMIIYHFAVRMKYMRE